MASSRRKLGIGAAIAGALAALLLALVASRRVGADDPGHPAAKPPASGAAGSATAARENTAGPVPANPSSVRPGGTAPSPAQDLGETMRAITEADVPLDKHTEGTPAPDFEPAIPDAEREQQLVNDYFERQVDPKLKECLASTRPRGHAKFSFVFVKNPDGNWMVARSSEELESAGVEDTEAISLVDSTMAEDMDDPVRQCMWDATAAAVLEPAARHANARYYRVYWRWNFD